MGVQHVRSPQRRLSVRGDPYLAVLKRLGLWPRAAVAIVLARRNPTCRFAVDVYVGVAAIEAKKEPRSSSAEPSTEPHSWCRSNCW
jgi:hypothetical protein